MSSKSNDQGRAYEFVCLLTLEEKIKKLRPVNIIKNSSYSAAERAWCTLSNEMQETYKASSYVAVAKIFELEPRIVENNNDILELLIQTDAKGKKGDVRDILIIRHNIQWEIGLSLKHNHFAVKHSRLSQKLDFGAKAEDWTLEKNGMEFLVHRIIGMELNQYSTISLQKKTNIQNLMN